VHFRTTSPRFCLRTIAATSHRPGLPNLVGGGVGRRHCQPSLWPRPTPINCTNGKSTVRSSQPKMMYRRFRGTYPRASAVVVLLDLPPLKRVYVRVNTEERGMVRPSTRLAILSLGYVTPFIGYLQMPSRHPENRPYLSWRYGASVKHEGQ